MEPSERALDNDGVLPSVGVGASATTGASVLRGGLWSTTSVVLPQLYTMGLSVAAARALGPDGMGRQSFIGFVEISAGMLLTGGLPFALMRYIGASIGEGRPGAVRDLVRWGWRLAAAGALIAAGVLVAVGVTRHSLRSAWVLAAVAAAIMIFHSVPSALLIGMQRWRDASIVGLTTGALGLVAGIAVLAAGGGIVGLFAVEVVVGSVNLTWTSGLARRAAATLADGGEGREDHDHTTDGSLDVVRAARRFAAIETLQVLMFFVVQRRSELFFLERYAVPKQIALYSIAFAATTAVIRVPQAFAGVLAPAVATLFGAGSHERIRTGFGRALRLMAISTMLLVAVVVAVGPAGLRLIYGAEYSQTGRVLLLMMAATPLIPVSAVAFTVVSGIGYQKAPLVIGALASALNIGCDFLLIPHHAAVGAAIANGIAQTAMAVAMIAYGYRTVGGATLHLSVVARAAVVAAAVAAAGYTVTSNVGGWLGVVAGLAACGAVLLAAGRLLRILAAEDAEWLEDAAGDRLRVPARVVCRAFAVTR